ncbi:hypothetical protein [Aureliella helgolandensis]|uniref:Uncharacterized protein n=1 Tax=Aureliella helgolandensis TaxID=2527968 RepID=A0A518G6X7_9BACT|nr:hypothetical protein [Aureliella helgolandensis]QDV24343.1 hypothetical protein Q31a_26590 [Aureliella helgolandensis]
MQTNIQELDQLKRVLQLALDQQLMSREEWGRMLEEVERLTSEQADMESIVGSAISAETCNQLGEWLEGRRNDLQNVQALLPVVTAPLSARPLIDEANWKDGTTAVLPEPVLDLGGVSSPEVQARNQKRQLQLDAYSDLKVNYGHRLLLLLTITGVVGLLSAVLIATLSILDGNSGVQDSRPYLRSASESPSTEIHQEAGGREVEAESPVPSPDTILLGQPNLESDFEPGSPPSPLQVPAAQELAAQESGDALEEKIATAAELEIEIDGVETDEPKREEITGILEAPVPVAFSSQTLRDTKSRIEQLVQTESWNEALELLDDRLAGELSERENEQLLLWKAGILFARSEDDSIMAMPAFNFLLEDRQLEIIAHSELWQSLYAAGLVLANKGVRRGAVHALTSKIEKLEAAGEEKDTESSLGKLLEWTEARNGARMADLPGFTRRIADFEATGLDHFFLIFSSLNAQNKTQAHYHLKQAKTLLDAEEQADQTRSQWLRELVRQRLSFALDRLEGSIVAGATPAG